MAGYFFRSINVAELSASTTVDENFNLKAKVVVENAIVKEVIESPSMVLCDSVSKLSIRLLAFLEKDGSPLKKFLEIPSCQKFLEDFLHYDKPEIGKLTPYMSFIEGIKAALGEPVSKESICTHLLLINKIGCCLWDCFQKKIPLSDAESDYVKQVIHQLFQMNNPGIFEAEATDRYQDFAEKVFPTRDEMDAIRVKRNKGFVPTKRSGISPKDGYGIYDSGAIEHIRGGDIWRVKHSLSHTNPFLAKALKYQLPLIAGASGTAVRWLSMAKLLMPATDLICRNAYCAAMACFIPYCGHHSFHEVAYVLRKAGVMYMEGDYTSIIPEDVLSRARIEEMIESAISEAPTLKHPHECPF